MRTPLLVLALALLALLPASAGAVGTVKQDVTIEMDDGVDIAATLYTPGGAAPAAGWPAIVFLHGLSGNRGQMNALAESYGFVGQDYAVLTFDARGHGASGGLVGIDGPREVADTRAVFNWLRTKQDVSDTKIGAWGISYGGGAIWNSLAAGVPWAAVEVAETWTDLYTALVPGGLVKSGLVAGLSGSIPAERRSPELDPVQAAAFSGTNLGVVKSFSAARSSIAKLGNVKTPVFMMQGRRDFLFGIDQATRAYAKLKGPKRLWIGNHGHAPSSFPASDTKAMLAEGKQWFDRYLRGVSNGIDKRPPVVLAREGKGVGVRFAGLPPRTSVQVALPKPKVATAKATATSKPTAAKLEVFGAPVVRVTATTRGGWARLVAILTARTPAGKEILVAAGGVTTRDGTRTYAIRLGDQATLIPRGSRLTVTIGSSTLAHNPSNILYLELPMPAGARLAAVPRVTLTVPALLQPIS